MVWVSTLGPFALLQRQANKRKFHATLKPRLDAEIEDWHKSQPDNTPQPVYKEDGWTMSIHSPWSDEQTTNPPD